MEKVNLKKELKSLYSASVKKPAFVDVPKLQYLMIDGAGYPEKSPDFQPSIEALYGTAYTLKFSFKLGPAQQDFGMMPLESLWWTESGEEFSPEHPEDWRWTLMVAVPDFVDAAAVRDAKKAFKEKKGSTYADRVRLKVFTEGKCVQGMHIGPYDQVEVAVDALRRFAEGNGYVLAGKHHEIYVSDPRRVPPERLKTIVRHPVKKKRR